MSNQLIPTKEIDRPLVIGMMRNFQKPNHLAVAAAHAAQMINCEFFFFNPKDIDFESRQINASFYEQGKWVKRLTTFPDVVDNSPSRKENREIYTELEKHVPLTMRRIGNKDVVNKRIFDDGLYNDLIIPFQLVENSNDVHQYLKKYKKIIIKPASGRQGKGIRFIEKTEHNYIVNENNTTSELDTEQLKVFFKQLDEARYIVQPYIQSLTDEGLPYDIRIHVRRGENGKWTPVKIYPRIGRADGITSNLSQGGSLAQLKPFLKREFPDKWRTLEAELNKLSINFPPYFQKSYSKPLDAIGLDIGIDPNGKLWLFEVNSYPGSTMFELESQTVAMAYAKYLAVSHKQQNNDFSKTDTLLLADRKQKIIGMFSSASGVDRLKSACVAAAAYYDCEFFYFTPSDIHYNEKSISGRTYQNGQWVDKNYCYLSEVDAIYDRIRRIGRKRFEKEYKELTHIPFTHTAFGSSLNKLTVYEKLEEEGTLKNYLIPYENYKDPESTIRFLEKHHEIIIKPHVGLGGANLYYISINVDDIKVIRKDTELNLSKADFSLWIDKIVGNIPYVLQKYINTRTAEGRPFDIRVHMMRNHDNKFEFVAIYPRIGLDFEKITALSEGGYISKWKGFIVKNYGEEKFKEINQNLRTMSRKTIPVFEKLFQENISDIAFDYAISKEGKLYLLELNLRRPGIYLYEFDVARRAIGYAKYLAEHKK